MNATFKAYFVLSWIVMIGICVVVGTKIKSTFWVPDYTQIMENSVPVAFDNATSSDPFYQEYVSTGKSPDIILSELIENSDLIVQVYFGGDRKLERLATLSTVKVENVMKGDQVLLGEIIYVYEDSFFLFNGRQPIYYLVHGNNLLRTGERYLLFLNHKNYPEEYQLNEADRVTYIMAQGTFSKYNLIVQPTSGNSTDYAEEVINFDQIEDADFLISDRSLASQYVKVKELILSKNYGMLR